MSDNEPTRLSPAAWPPPGVEQMGLPSAASRGAVLPRIGPDRRPRRVIMLCAIAVVAGTAGLLALVLPSGDGPGDGQTLVDARIITPVPPTTVVATPPETSAATVSPSPSPSPSTTAAPSPSAAVTSTRPAPTTPAGPPFPPVLRVGATIGLEVAGRPGLRVHDREFAARVDPLSAAGSALDKAGSRFVVRQGLAFDGCVSFESADHPGFFLRRFFADLLLHKHSDATIYEQEATFCPIPTSDGKAFTLLALFPSGFAVDVAPDGTLHLDSSDRTAPTAFVVRRPL